MTAYELVENVEVGGVYWTQITFSNEQTSMILVEVNDRKLKDDGWWAEINAVASDNNCVWVKADTLSVKSYRTWN